jgi:hypothetical protein
VADDLLEGGVSEAVELHLDHGLVAVHGHADRRPDDARLRKGCVEAALFAEALLQLVGDPEHSAEGADVLAEHHHLVVGFHRVVKGGVQRLRHRDRHRY